MKIYSPQIIGDTSVSGALNVQGDVTGSSMYLSNGAIIAGDLTVNGTTTYISSSTLQIGDNIIEINYNRAAGPSGMIVYDTTSPFTASMLWDDISDAWKAGPYGAESPIILANQTASMSVASASFAEQAGTSGFASQAGTSGFATSASFADQAGTSGFATSASFASQAGTAGFATSASFATTASFALTAATFPFTGNAVISGSLVISASAASTASNVVGNWADTFTSSPAVHQIITLTQAEYNALTPNANTLYVISGSTFTAANLAGNNTFTGNNVFSGSVRGEVEALSISSNTASMDLSGGNFFTLQLVSGSNTFINPTNIQPGQTVNLRVNTTGSATVSFPSSVKQVSGSAYVPTTTTGVDVVTFIAFDSSTLYLSNVKNLV